MERQNEPGARGVAPHTTPPPTHTNAPNARPRFIAVNVLCEYALGAATVSIGFSNYLATLWCVLCCAVLRSVLCALGSGLWALCRAALRTTRTAAH